MSKKIVILTASARANSNTNAMAEQFQESALEKGYEVVRLDISKLNVGYCHACNKCYSNGNACIFNDDFNMIAEEIIHADGIVIACPVYWYTFPANIKAVIDKFYGLYVGGKMFTGKKAALISCCEEETMSTFDGINFAFDRSFELMGAEIAGKVEITGVNEEGEIHNTNGLLKAKELVDLFSGIQR